MTIGQWLVFGGSQGYKRLPSVDLTEEDIAEARRDIGRETPVVMPSVSALLQQFRREVAEHLRARGIALKGTS